MKALTAIFLTLTLSACGVAKNAQYSTLEQFGVHKRDILVDRIEKTTQTQEQTKAQVKSAYEELSELIQVNEAGLEKKYKSMAKAVEKSEAKAQQLNNRIQAVDQVAKDLFREWEAELKAYTSDRLRTTSANNLATTRQRYQAILGKMRASAERVTPVLQILQDNTLFLKHNLNARAVAGIGGELTSIESKVSLLIEQMEASIAESQRFVKSMQGS